MHSEILKLIEISKKDGVLSETDEKIILEKAYNLGLSKLDISNLKSQFYETDINTEKNNLPVYDVSCPNCGASVKSNDVNCSYCNFLLIDKDEINRIDNFIVGLEEKLTVLKKLSSITFYEILLVASAIFMSFILVLELFVSEKIPQIFLIITFFYLILNYFLVYKNKRSVEFFTKYIKLKKEFFKEISRFSDDSQSNNRLIQIRDSFLIANKANNKKIIIKAFFSSIIFSVILFFVYTNLFSPYLYQYGKIKHTNVFLKVNEFNISDEFDLDIEILTENISIEIYETTERYDLVITKQDITYSLDPIYLNFGDNFFNDSTILMNIQFSLTFFDENNGMLDFPVFRDNKPMWRIKDSTKTYIIDPNLPAIENVYSLSLNKIISSSEENQILTQKRIKQLESMEYINLRLEISYYD